MLIIREKLRKSAIFQGAIEKMVLSQKVLFHFSQFTLAARAFIDFNRPNSYPKSF